jgi:hypothetical protein
MHLQGNVTVERAALAVHLVQEARRLYPAIQFHFDTAIQVCDVACSHYVNVGGAPVSRWCYVTEGRLRDCCSLTSGLAVQGRGGDADH